MEILSFATAWIKLEDTSVCEISRHRYLPFPSPFLSIIGRVIKKKNQSHRNRVEWWLPGNWGWEMGKDGKGIQSFSYKVNKV